MSAQSAAPKSTSRWGSFLQQAVAGVESRLDTILADDDNTNARPKDTSNQRAEKTESSSASPNPRSSTEISRSLSRSRKSDRLQERLAKAVVSRSNTKLTENSSTATASGQPRVSSPSNSTASLQTTLDSKTDESALNTHQSTGEEFVLRDPVLINNGLRDVAHTSNVVQPLEDSIEVYNNLINEVVPHSSTEYHVFKSLQPSLDVSKSAFADHLAFETVEKETSTIIPLQHEETLAQLRSDYESAELRRQGEMHEYLERIDALQAKLQYLTKEAIENARKSASDAQRDPVEARLAAKDEKIGLLMDEGQKLSQMELKHLSSIRNLRAKAIEDAKELSQARKSINDYQTTISVADERARRVETLERGELERSKVLQRMEKELEKSKAENQSLATLMIEIRQQLAHAKTSSKAEDAFRYRDMLESEQRLVSELRDDLSSMKIEKELTSERNRAHTRELQDKTERERERTKVTDQELRSEIRVLESRLESFRARAEEGTSVNTGGSQVKLLRQVETLQTQYAVATENWRGIESSLLSRITSLEKETADVNKKYFDVRRNAREANAKIHRLEEDLHKSMSTIQQAKQQSAEKELQLARFKQRLSEAEEDAKAAKTELHAEKDTWQLRLDERLEEIKNESRECINSPAETVFQSSSAESPMLSNRKKSIADRAGPVQKRYYASPSLGLTAGAIPSPDRPSSRCLSAQVSATSSSGTLQRHDSTQSIAHQPVNSGIRVTETPSIRTEHEDFFDGVTTPATPERTINDMVSVSTAAAGPSVQLVERMSAAVRRLESEKASYKDELERLSTQRDEAREQVVALMNQIEEKRLVDEKIQSLQTEVIEINQRYQTTLEMLGEKSELVEELQADIGDLKQMYRDLVENTMQ